MAADPQLINPAGVILIADADGLILTALGRCTAVTGWHPRKLIGRTLVGTIIPVKYRAAHLAGLEHYRRTGEAPVRGIRLAMEALDPLGFERPVWLTVLGEDDGMKRFYALLEVR